MDAKSYECVISMKDNLPLDYFTLEKTAQAEIIQACALFMKVDPIIIEKDLWVVLTLQALFDETQHYNAHKARNVFIESLSSY